MNDDQQQPIPVQYHVSYEQPQTNHLLHLVLCIVTLGFWFPIWILVAIVNATSAPQEKITGVYGAPQPGQIGSGGLPPRPGSYEDMIDPAGHQKRLERAHRNDTIKLAAIGGFFTLIAVPSYWPVALLLAAGTGAFVWYRIRSSKAIAQPEQTEG